MFWNSVSAFAVVEPNFKVPKTVSLAAAAPNDCVVAALLLIVTVSLPPLAEKPPPLALTQLKFPPPAVVLLSRVKLVAPAPSRTPPSSLRKLPPFALPAPGRPASLFARRAPVVMVVAPA